MRACCALVRGDQLKLIGGGTEKRLTEFPDVPTVSESGLPGFFFNSWFAILAPRDAEGHHRQVECRGCEGGWRSRHSPQAGRAVFCGARKFGRGSARHDARSAHQIRGGDLTWKYLFGRCGRKAAIRHITHKL